MLLHTDKKKYDLLKETLVMGILNITPDSFSDGGKFLREGNAVKQAESMVQNGAHIIDIGGESTRPGHKPVSAEEETERIVPVFQALSNKVQVPLSVDTYKAKTAEAALKHGADIINDVWGAKKDPDIADVAANHNAPIVLMHNRENKHYDDLMEDMKRDLYESINIAKKAGVPDHNIILDPGIGFAKTMKQNLLVIRRLHELQIMGYPILLGTSRKSFIGHVLNAGVDERVEGTGATVCIGIEKGAHIVRVHDVKSMARIAKMTDAMIGKGE
ncbi:dihydropteroate synthase [Salirhabdus salicampi]|uniref:dihydropteroate synthase n=1 Tax=Salirhabdus salicampi TaxID=476102 RepID=UPI0020C23819|nr:dihydropteroate synthase [Salirhabdus salicampi]MCP8618195.1 dihydropteroate synthase [Salirhabdus salicampi]